MNEVRVNLTLKDLDYLLCHVTKRIPDDKLIHKLETAQKILKGDYDKSKETDND